jgi:tRNA nucleotidyltransferase (CCA-adding enzyme)
MTLRLPPLLSAIVRSLGEAGYRVLVVGGAVRDSLLGGEPKDFDIEVHGIGYDRLAGFLSEYGRVDLVGKSFGVVKLNSGGHEYDFSVPRRDSKFGLHHRDFHATFDEEITPQEAASRRDFTINAMAYDPVEEKLLDFFGGAEDLKNRVLRATGPAFTEDPLRVLRGMQFACRFDLTLDPETAAMCNSIVDQYGTIAKERVADEFMKWAIKSSRPGRISDAAARVAERESLQGDDRAVLLFAALCHDFAKATTTALRERDGKLRWTSWGHEADGGPMARGFLERIGIKNSIVERVVRMVENHLASSSIGRDVTPRAVRRLAMRLAPATITDLVRLIEADYSGRPPLPVGLPEGAMRIREMAEAQAVHQGPQPPLILGRHVLPYFDDRPGKHIGEVTSAAYEAQADGAFSNLEEALGWLESYMAARTKI